MACARSGSSRAAASTLAARRWAEGGWNTIGRSTGWPRRRGEPAAPACWSAKEAIRERERQLTGALVAARPLAGYTSSARACCLRERFIWPAERESRLPGARDRPRASELFGSPLISRLNKLIPHTNRLTVGAWGLWIWQNPAKLCMSHSLTLWGLGLSH